jgi:hypothetical protein
MFVSWYEMLNNDMPLIRIYRRIDRGRESVKGKDGIIQLLDYALERFDFEDKKG